MDSGLGCITRFAVRTSTAAMRLATTGTDAARPLACDRGALPRRQPQTLHLLPQVTSVDAQRVSRLLNAAFVRFK